jgi:Bifunctional DNA primase/polymerase, N-terminal
LGDGRVTGYGAAALRYAAAGWPVFPCKPASKEPATVHGFKDATTDPARITRWWTARPDCNVAIATGQPGPDVVDVDVRPEGSGYAAFNRLWRAGLLARARSFVTTPSGGFHLYFTGTGQPCGRLPGHFIDFKSCGGYVVAPPSATPAGEYTIADHRAGSGEFTWRSAVALLEPAAAYRPGGNGSGGDVRYLAEWVAGLAEGNRNNGLFWAACRAIETGHAGDLERLAAAAVQAGLTEAEARQAIASAAKKAGA